MSAATVAAAVRPSAPPSGRDAPPDLLASLVRPVTWDAPEALLEHEWLVTNGLGGYAAGTLSDVVTRRYHGVLVAALPEPHGRMLLCNQLAVRCLLADGTEVALGGQEQTGERLELGGARALRAFRLEGGLPVWEYALPDGSTLERRLVMPHGQNTVVQRWARRGGTAPARLELRPALHFRGYEDPVTASDDERYTLAMDGDHFVVTGRHAALPPVRFAVHGDDVSCLFEQAHVGELHYRVETARGYPSTGALWSPGAFRVTLPPEGAASLVVSTEDAAVLAATAPDDAFALERERRRRLLAACPAARAGDVVAAELALAADQFLVRPAGRMRDRVRARAVGDEVRTVIAGYHWFTDWGRDTMIALEGLTLTTGRWREAGFILRTFAEYVRDGLIPNYVPDGAAEGVYHTADATLWFFHALHRYVTVTGDRDTLRALLPTMTDIAARHVAGTKFGIGVDPADGLLRQGAEGYQLTWMDAKCDGWVVTPRRGKAVEINALWYNALRLLADWTRAEGDARAAAGWDAHADRASDAFNARFWDAGRGHCLDVVDGPAGDDAACRPNQLLAIALPYAVLDAARWPSVLAVVERELVTPVGLRSLAPGHPDYQPRYFGDLRARDAAYHQGTVWGWLIGPWVDAWRRVHPDDAAGARRWLEGLVAHLGEFGVGSVAEVFDAEPPFTPRGCIAQAWSVAELLRCWTAAGRSAEERATGGSTAV
ncbi:MAG TPA: amylo-alpha-1,6-glucosidase [Gemmatirosa sp.]|nr:amylo-alpha-1,6-glucosidase [Gemmatirosa sp.]